MRIKEEGAICVDVTRVYILPGSDAFQILLTIS